MHNSIAEGKLYQHPENYRLKRILVSYQMIRKLLTRKQFDLELWYSIGTIQTHNNLNSKRRQKISLYKQVSSIHNRLQQKM